MDDLSDRRFYVYAYLREDGSPYYIGKGTKSRAFIDSGRPVKRPPPERITFLSTGLTEAEAFDLERHKIAEYGRKDNSTGILRNKSDGGEGPAGRVVTQESREKIRKANTGYKHTATAKAKMKGRVMSVQSREAISNTLKGRLITKSHRDRLSVANAKRTYVVSSPNGTKILVNNLSKFAREHTLSAGHLVSVAAGRRKHHKGFTVRYES